MLDSLPETIKVGKELLVNKGGRPETATARRKNSTIVKGRVKGKQTYYSDKEKLKVVCTYAVSGNSRRTAEITKISEATIRSWKQTEWWNEIMSRIITEQDEELGVKLTALIDKAVEGVNERLDNGDWVYNAKLDKLVRKPINAKDLAVVTAITVDKRQLLRGQPTSRVEKVSVDERLKKLGQQFEMFAKAKEVVQLPEEDDLYAIEIGEEQEGFQIEREDGDSEWETTEAGSGDSLLDAEEVQEEDEEGLTINELFSEDA